MIYILDISPALTVLPYALLYYALLLISSGLALLMLQHSAASGKQALKTALLVIFLTQLILLTTNLLAYQGIETVRTLFPLMHRSLNLICLVWLIWALFQTRELEFPNWPPAVATVLVLLAAILLGLWWLPITSDQNFNQSWMDIAWTAFTLVLILAAGIAYVLRYRREIFLPVLTLAIAAFGFLLYLFLPAPGSLPAVVMLSQLIYYPLLISLSAQGRFEEMELATAQSVLPVDKNDSMRASLANAFLDLSVQPGQEQVEKALSHTLSLYLMSDLLGLLKFNPGDTTAQLKNTYDLIREDHIPLIDLPVENFPFILKAFAESEPVLVNEKSRLRSEKQALMNLSGYNQIGNLLFYPISSPENQIAWGLLGLTPYTAKTWGQDDLDKLDQLKSNLSKVLEKASVLEQNSQKITSLQTLLAAKQADYQSLDQEFQKGQSLLADLNQNLEETQLAWTDEVTLWINRQKDLEVELESLQKTIEDNQESMAQIDLLRQQKQELEETIAHNSEQANQLKTAIEQAQQLINQLASSDSSNQEPDLLPTNDQED